MLLLRTSRRLLHSPPTLYVRAVSTLPNNPHIYYFADAASPGTYTLSLLPANPSAQVLSVARTTSIPPTPQTTRENEFFLPILHSVLRQHAYQDPNMQAQAAALSAQSGAAPGHGFLAPPNHPSQQYNRQRHRKTQSDRSHDTGAGAASQQAGAGGAGRGGWIHVSDLRAPPDFGRIANPEDIFGSLEVDGEGKFVDGTGRYQESGTYRIVTRDGILGLSPFLTEKLVERLRELDGAGRR